MKNEDQNLAWFLFKMAFKLFFSMILFSIAAMIDEDTTANNLNDLLDEIKNDL